jgi:hypothetical protein
MFESIFNQHLRYSEFTLLKVYIDWPTTISRPNSSVLVIKTAAVITNTITTITTNLTGHWLYISDRESDFLGMLLTSYDVTDLFSSLLSSHPLSRLLFFLIHSLIHSLIHLLSHSFLHSFTQSFTHSLTLTPSLTHSFIHSLTH